MGAEKDGQESRRSWMISQAPSWAEAFDVLAEGVELDVILAVEDAAGHVAGYTLPTTARRSALKTPAEGAQPCALARRQRQSSDPVRYALACGGAVADDRGAYRGRGPSRVWQAECTGFSAFSLVDGKGTGDNFTLWTDPAPAGEGEENLLE